MGFRSFSSRSRNVLWVGQKSRGRHVLLSNRDCSGSDRLDSFLRGTSGQEALVEATMYCTRHCLRTALRAAADIQRYVPGAG